MRIVPPTPEGIAVAVEAIGMGEIVAYPTETVYGLGVDPFNVMAVQRLFAVKDREGRNPVLLIIDEPARVSEIASTVSAAALAYAEAFWPGPLSLVLPKAAALPDLLTAGLPRVCVRCPGSQLARDLCRAAGGVLTSTSANRSGDPPALAIEEISLGGIAVGMDGGRLTPSLPSTVVDPETGTILRHGAVPETAIRAQFPR